MNSKPLYCEAISRRWAVVSAVLSGLFGHFIAPDALRTAHSTAVSESYE
jgi:hypothetical protein